MTLRRRLSPPGAVFGLALAAVALAANDIQIDSPRNGWRNSAIGEDQEAEFRAAYPKPPIDRGGQRNRSLIEGALRRVKQGRASGFNLIYVNYWGNFSAAGYNFDANAHEKPLITTRITIVTDENSPGERQETLTVPLRRIGGLTFVRALRYGEKK